MERLGFIGLGIMGLPMAKNLLSAGYEVLAYDIEPARVKEAETSGARAAASIAEVAKSCKIIITMLPNSPHVQQVVLGEDGVLANAAEGTLLVDMSSISPVVAREVAAKCAEKGVDMLDAPVSGGEPKAIEGTLAIMVGGSQAAFVKMEPIFACLGSSYVLVGDIGSGNVTKLANQVIVALNIAAMGEAMTLAAKCGVDPEKVYNAINKGLAGSTVLDAKMPMVLAGNFNPGFRIELHNKDLQNALDAAHNCHAPLPLTAVVMEEMQSLLVKGEGALDHSAIVRYYERTADIEVRRVGCCCDQ